MPDKKGRDARREHQALELEKNQRDLRDSIATSQRLAHEAEAMIQRHRREREDEPDLD